ncbi:MAG: biopolymer transporter ExbD [Pseudomonadota bacterium]
MNSSRRANRMARRHKRNKVNGLNLVSLMDIFTILVFFLLVNSSNVTQLPSTNAIKLPESSAEALPEETLVIMVSSDQILIQGREIASVKQITRSDNEIIPSLLQELKLQEENRIILPGDDPNKPGEVTIMGHKEIPYKLLRKIMTTLSQSRYTNISLAVQKKPKEAA